LSAIASFFSLRPERVLEAVEFGGRRATGYALALNSLENRVYEVELEDGERLVAKFYRPGRWSAGAILEEHAFLRELAAEEVPVVPPIALDGGSAPDARTLGSMAGDEGGVIHYAVFPRVRGRVPDELSGEQLAWLGRLVARLHLVGERRPAPARPALDPASYGSASLERLLASPWVPPDQAARMHRIGEAVVHACQRAFASAPQDAIRIHGDCHLGNLLWSGDGPRFVDFDDFLCGPPVQDLWLLAPAPDDDGRQRRAALLEAYRSLRRMDGDVLRLVEPLRALRMLRYQAWISDRYIDAGFQRAFPDFEEPAHWEREIAALDEQLARIRATSA
jgi:Ser/Thr protein kinase RdoA (MazF antagonist)